MDEQNNMTVLGSLTPTHFLQELPGLVALKAMKTMMVLARIEDAEMVKGIPKVTCCSIQVISTGRPRNRNTERKLSMRERSRMKLRFRLLALTMGVLRNQKNSPSIKRDAVANMTEVIEKNKTRMSSLYDKYSLTLSIQIVLALLGHSFSGHFLQSSLSVE